MKQGENVSRSSSQASGATTRTGCFPSRLILPVGFLFPPRLVTSAATPPKRRVGESGLQRGTLPVGWLSLAGAVGGIRGSTCLWRVRDALPEPGLVPP